MTSLNLIFLNAKTVEAEIIIEQHKKLNSLSAGCNYGSNRATEGVRPLRGNYLHMKSTVGGKGDWLISGWNKEGCVASLAKYGQGGRGSKMEDVSYEWPLRPLNSIGEGDWGLLFDDPELSSLSSRPSCQMLPLPTDRPIDKDVECLGSGARPTRLHSWLAHQCTSEKTYSKYHCTVHFVSK